MSKLYDVISRLEDAADQDAKGFESPSPEKDEEVRKFQSPSVRIILFSLLFVILGTLAVALTAWWQNWFIKRDIALVPKNVHMQQEQQSAFPTKGTPLQAVLPTDKNNTVNRPASTTPNKTQETIPNHQPLIIDDELLPDTMVADVGHMDRTVETIDDFLKKRIFDQFNPERAVPLKNVRIYIHDLDIAEAVVEEELLSVEETFPASHSTNINESKAKTSRWLHQAELYRHNGEWDGAIALYRRVWDISGEPDVANNLAAALIQVNRLEEALKILQEGSSIAPNDPDIKENFEILKQLLRQP